MLVRHADVRRVALVVATIALAATAADAGPAGRASTASATFQNPPPQAPAEVADATARITGQVVAADTGAPVKRTPVIVSGGTPQRTGTGGAPLAVAALGGSSPQMPPGMARRETTTDDGGRFECTGLPPGRYVVMVRSSGVYVSAAPQTVQLASGGSASVTIRLERGGSITGRVFDDEGEPVVGAQVWAGQRRSVSGAWRLMPVGAAPRATTDDLGQFRLYGLPPGEFYVTAAFILPAMGRATAPPGSERRDGFSTTFYPSATGIDGARAVVVRTGQETGGIDVTLVRAKLASISGRVTDSIGAVLGARQVSVMLTAPRDMTSGTMLGPTVWQDEGLFVFPNVPPGRYLVVARVRQAQPVPSPPTEEGFEIVSIDGNDLAVNLQTNAGATVSGRVVIEGARPVQTGSVAGMTGQLRVSVSPRYLDSDFYISSSSRGPAPVGEDLTFALGGLRGQVLPMASVSGAALKAVTHGGQDITATGLWLRGTESVEDVTITLTTDTAAIAGTVATASGAPAEAWVVVFPDDPSKWFPGSPFVRITRSRAAAMASEAAPGAPAPGTASTELSSRASTAAREAGGFTMPTLLPGRYAVAAITASVQSYADASQVPPTDRESLARLRAGATIVSVAAGETGILKLTIGK